MTVIEKDKQIRANGSLSFDDLKEKYGEDITVISKGTEPFPMNEEGKPLGLVLQNSKGENVCLECGQWFKFLASHLQKHKMKADDYRAKYSLLASQGLCNEDMSRKFSHNVLQTYASGNLNPISHENTLKGLKALKEKDQTETIQERNEKEICPSQIARKLIAFLKEHGEHATQMAARLYGGKREYWARKYFGGWNEMKKELGGKTNKSFSDLKKDDDVLINDMVEFVAEHKMLPYSRKAKNLDFSHSKNAYIGHFGSFQRALAVCGIERGAKVMGWNNLHIWNVQT